MGVTTVLIVGR